VSDKVVSTDKHHDGGEAAEKRSSECVGGNIVHHVTTHDDLIEYLMAHVVVAGGAHRSR